MSEYRIWREKKAAKPHKCWSCQGTIHRGEWYEVETIFEKGQKPERLAECRQCTWLYLLVSDDAFGPYGTRCPAYDWDGDVPKGWGPMIAAWRNGWIGPDGEPYKHHPEYGWCEPCGPMPTLSKLFQHFGIDEANERLEGRSPWDLPGRHGHWLCLLEKPG